MAFYSGKLEITGIDFSKHMLEKVGNKVLY